jgi:methyltransferase (TIGR00027 family)
MRPDGNELDTWDITTSVGSTALFVAAARALEAKKSDPLAVDPYAEVFCRAVGGQWAEVLDGGASDSKLKTEFGVHFVNFQGARTHYFDDFFARAAEAGVRQVVILAAGLDSRAYRLAWPDGTVVYELDRPKVLEFKRDVLRERGDTPTAERVEIAVDLREDWPTALRAAGFEPQQPAAFIAEGLLVYLPASAQGDLFRAINALAAVGSYVGIEEGEPVPSHAFEAMKAAEEAAVSAGGVQVGRFFTLIYNQQFARADEWFGDRGWQAVRTPLADYLRKVDRPLPEEASESDLMVRSNTLVSAIKRES